MARTSHYIRELHEYRKSERELAYELRHYIECGVPFDGPEIRQTVPEAQRRELARAFDHWAKSWLWPIAQQLAHRAGVPLNEFQLRETFAAAMAAGKHEPDDWRQRS